MSAPRALVVSVPWLVLALLAPALPALAGPSGPQDLARGMDHVLGRRGPPDLRVVQGGVECLGYVSPTAEDEPLLWYVVPRRGEPGVARVVRGLPKSGADEVARACGAAAGLLARVVRATCFEPADLVDLLATPDVLALHAPGVAVPGPRSPVGFAEELGCAKVVTSRDGRARVWTPLRERWVAPPDHDRAGAGVRRGLALLQVKDDGGTIRVHVDRSRGEDLHLDASIESIEPAPERGRWLVMGVRAEDARGPGAVARRFAIVLEPDRAGGMRVARGRFELDGVRRDLLLLQGPPVAPGQLRVHALRARRLEWSPDDASLRLSPTGDSRVDAGARGRPAVAIWTGSAFHVLGRTWDAMVERPGDARVVLADRWAAAEELGERDLGEIAVARRPERRGPTAAERARALFEGRSPSALAAAGELGQ